MRSKLQEQFAEEVGGGWLFGYVAALQSAGHRAVVICPSASVTATTKLVHRATGAPIWCVAARRRGPSRHPDLGSLRRWAAEPCRQFESVLRKEGCDRILCQEYESTRFDRLTRVSSRLGIPLFASFQGGDWTASWIEGVVRKRTLRRAAGLIVASTRERQRLSREYPGLDLPVADIFNPLDTEEWRSSPRDAARDRLGLEPSAFVAINHGRVDIRRKGHDALLQAWQVLSKERPEARLVLLGSGQDQDELGRLLTRSGLSNVLWNSEFTTDRELIRLWLSAADLYVSASRVEGMPVAPLEAMACSLPVVATDAQGISEILPRGEASGGLVVERDDIAGLVRCLNRFADDPQLRRRVGAAGRERVERVFSIEAVGAALTEFLGGAAP